MKLNHLLILAGLMLLVACAATQSRNSASAAGVSENLPADYMPEWSDTSFGEAAVCAFGILPPGQRYADTVIAARKHDFSALKQVIECSFSPRCGAYAGELHSGVLQQLLLAWGDTEFSSALAAVKAKHHNHYPSHAFLLNKHTMVRFFPLTAHVLYE